VKSLALILHKGIEREETINTVLTGNMEPGNPNFRTRNRDETCDMVLKRREKSESL